MYVSWLEKLFKIKSLSNTKTLKKCTYIKDSLGSKNKIQQKHSNLGENLTNLFGSRPSTEYNCQYNCRFASNDPNLLKKHIKKYHSSNNDNFVCPYCNATFRKMKSFEIHKVIYCTATNISLSL
uniref:C2H2-type domain-containing protein n=1 Tax=Strongyloides venezuelensis TaxID=75913 RepID=A0A0K0FY73_STRVS